VPDFQTALPTLSGGNGGTIGQELDSKEQLDSGHEIVDVLNLPPLLRPASWATTADQIRAYYPNPLDIAKTKLPPEFLQQLNRFSDELGRTLDEHVRERSLFVDMVKGTGLALSAGLVAWLVRGGALIAGLMASLPAWRHFDPVPILGMNKKDKKALNQRMKEAGTMEAQEHHDVVRILQGTEHMPPSSSSTQGNTTSL
jgi:hypothetical protein